MYCSDAVQVRKFLAEQGFPCNQVHDRETGGCTVVLEPSGYTIRSLVEAQAFVAGANYDTGDRVLPLE